MALNSSNLEDLKRELDFILQGINSNISRIISGDPATIPASISEQISKIAQGFNVLKQVEANVSMLMQFLKIDPTKLQYLIDNAQSINTLLRVVEHNLNPGSVNLDGEAITGTLKDINIGNPPSGYNLLINSDFINGFDGWGYDNGEIVTAVSPRTGINAAQNVEDFKFILTGIRRLPVSLDRGYILEGYAKHISGATGKASLGVILLDEDLAPIAGDTSDIWFLPYDKQTPGAGFTLIQEAFGYATDHDFPADARWMYPICLLNETIAGDVGDSIQQIQGIRIRESIESAYIRDLSADRITAGTLTGRTVQTKADPGVGGDRGRMVLDSDTNTFKAYDTDGNCTINLNGDGTALASISPRGLWGYSVNVPDGCLVLFGVASGYMGTNYPDYAYVGRGSKSPILLIPSASAAAPAHEAAIGSLWVTSVGVLYINIDGATTWQKVGAQ